jgi:hypothetical protein
MNDQAAKSMSLMDLMTVNTDDVAILMSRLPTQGIFIVRGKEVKREAMPAKTPEQDDMVKILIQTEIAQAWPMDKDLDPKDFIGKNITDLTMYTVQNYKDRIGLLKGNYKKIGLPHEGKMGGTPEEKGWLDGILGFPFQLRVRHSTNKNTGADMAWIDWSRIDAEHEAAVFEAFGIPLPEAFAKAA